MPSAPEDGETAGHSPYVQRDVGGLPSRISLRARRRMLGRLLDRVRPTAATRVLDVGATSDRRVDSNFFEKLYPWPAAVVATGVEPMAFLRDERPGLTLVQADGLALPFPDRSFDLAVCFAVIEHVGSRERQRRLVHELCRVARRCCIATPNRWYPVEFHSLLPLVHWLPPARFRALLRRLGRGFWAEEANLNLLSERDLRGLFPAGVALRTDHHRLLGPVSNLVIHGEWTGA